MRRRISWSIAIAVLWLALAPIRPAFAQGTAITAGAAAGAAASVTSTNAPAADARLSLPGWELADWKDPKTRSTSRLAYQCEVIAELHLSGLGGKNFLGVSLANMSASRISFDPHRVTVQFGTGLTRQLAPLQAGGTTLDSGWSTHREFVFPDKRDFRGQDTMTVNLQIVQEDGDKRACSVHATLVRAPGVAPRASTYTPHTLGEVMFGLGARFAASGGPKTLDGNRGSSLEFGFYVYPWLHHGLFLDIMIDGYGTDAIRTVLPTATPGNGAHITGTGFMPGYMLRFYGAPWLSLSYGLSAGPYAFELAESSDSGVISRSTILSVRERVRLGFRAWLWNDGGELQIAPTLVHTYVPYGHFGAIDAAGSTLTASVQVAIGF